MESMFTKEEMEKCFEAGFKFAKNMSSNPSNSEYINKVMCKKRSLSFEDWFDKNEDEINIELVENGADREMCFDSEKEFLKRYEKYLEGGI